LSYEAYIQDMTDPTWQHNLFLKTVMTLLPDARLVGGVVRDHLLKRPVHDLDLAVPLPPRTVMQTLMRAGIGAIPTGVKYGTVTAVCGTQYLQITSLRREISYHNRKPKVVFGKSFLEDARRRDFTINALYADFEGHITDLVGGVPDVEQGLVRFIGNAHERIIEDPLRIMRFWRFVANGYQSVDRPLDLESRTACREHKDRLTTLSGERIAGEGWRLLSAPHLGRTLKLMDEDGLLPYLGWVCSDLVDKVTDLDGDVVSMVRLALLCTDPAVLCGIWRLSNREQQQLQYLKRLDIHGTPPLYRLLDEGGYFWAKTAVWYWAVVGNVSRETLEEWLGVLAEKQGAHFPVQSIHLMERGLSGVALGRALKQLRLAWQDSGFLLEEAELLKKLDVHDTP
jgi:poly(A) polymerase